MNARLLAAVAAALAAPAASAAADAPLVGEGFEVERYALSLTPDLSAKSVVGEEEITVRSVRDGLRSLVFSPNALVIDGATVEGSEVEVSSAKGGITIALPAPLPRGRKVTLSLRYHGVPARGVTITGASMYTSYFACDWMVCLQDAPGDSAQFALDLQVPEGLTSLAAGRMVGVKKAADGAVIHRWRSARPYPAYLFGFALGPFARSIHRSGNGELVYLGEATPSDLTQLFAETPKMVAFLSDKAGLPLPGASYVQLLVPGREAQEAATYSLIGRGELERSIGDPSSDWVIVHELAHQWWGNLVTCATWRDFWLNEGITTFMTAAWKQHRFGASAYEAELAIARGRLARVQEAGWDRPLAFAGDYPNIRTRRAIQYSKGALFMAHLRTVLGERAFWAGLKTFTRDNAGRSVTSADLQRAMERASRRDLSAVFAEWVYG
jgi:aminopeptidase N